MVKEGLVGFAKAYQWQERVFQAKLRGNLPAEVLFLLEHPPTFTQGTQAGEGEILVSARELKKRRIPVFQIGRGGKVTYHGPGQLVGYPIFDLNNFGRDLHLYLRMLEEVIICALKDMGITAGRQSQQTGVWIRGEKIASMGIQVKKWITRHGFALNVSPDLSYFNLIVPCGLPDVTMTSLEEVLKKDLGKEEIIKKVVSQFSRLFGLRMEEIPWGDLVRLLGEENKSRWESRV